MLVGPIGADQQEEVGGSDMREIQVMSSGPPGPPCATNTVSDLCSHPGLTKVWFGKHSGLSGMKVWAMPPSRPSRPAKVIGGLEAVAEEARGSASGSLQAVCSDKGLREKEPLISLFEVRP